MMLLRLAATLTGITASASAASSPATAPKVRLTRRYSTATERTPARAWGSIRLRPENPKTLALATCSQKPSGGLSMVTKPPGSNALNRKLCQLCSMLLTAAA